MLRLKTKRSKNKIKLKNKGEFPFSLMVCSGCVETRPLELLSISTDTYLPPSRPS